MGEVRVRKQKIILKGKETEFVPRDCFQAVSGKINFINFDLSKYLCFALDMQKIIPWN